MRGGTLALLAVCLTGSAAIGAEPASSEAPIGRPPAIAIIVNPLNRVPDPSLEDLRILFTLEQQFWPDGRRVALFLPPPGSVPKDVLLRCVYAMSDFELRKYWVGKLFRGAIPSIPSTLPTAADLSAAVRTSPGGLSAVLASEIPPNVRVLKIDGKSPTDPDYPLLLPR